MHTSTVSSARRLIAVFTLATSIAAASLSWLCSCILRMICSSCIKKYIRCIKLLYQASVGVRVQPRLASVVPLFTPPKPLRPINATFVFNVHKPVINNLLFPSFRRHRCHSVVIESLLL